MLIAAHRPKLLAVALVAALGAVLVTSTGAAAPNATSTGSYIVVLDDSVADPAAAAAAAGVTPTYVYRYALKGYAAPMSATAAAAIANRPNVRSVEPDGIATISVTQSPATWGLDRIDQRSLPLNNSYVYTQTGAGVTAYIIDTGLRITHNEFGGRASIGTDTIGDGNGPDCNGGTIGDPSVSGHGTHVAGTVGGTTYGVAKNVTLVSVRVLNCFGSGTWAQVIAGIDWVTGDHGPGELAVANMSLGGGFNNAVNTAVTTSIADGVSYAVAAGNSNANACSFSPASTPNALTIGSTTITDARSSFSNVGTCLDLFAPGSGITSAWNNSNTATNTISGTSMATPHTAGAAALYLQANPSATPSQVSSAVVANATTGVVGNPGHSSPNRLLYTGSGAPPPGGPPTISGFSPSSGPVGTSVTINGTNFTGATSVTFNFASASFAVSSPTQITATVPSGATSGHIRVTTPGGTAASTGNFTVTAGGSSPTISGFSPPSGPVGTLVTINGTNFTGASSVTFNFVGAAFTVVNASQITATVPAGATNGHIRVTTPGGTATSTGNFVVS